MKHALIASVAALGVLAAAPAVAQTSVTTTTTAPTATGSITIAPEKRTVIKQRFTGAPVTTVKEKVTVGATVPADVELMAAIMTTWCSSIRRAAVWSRSSTDQSPSPCSAPSRLRRGGVFRFLRRPAHQPRRPDRGQDTLPHPHPPQGTDPAERHEAEAAEEIGG